MGVSSDLQRLIVARLRSAVPAVEGRVYDRRAPESAEMPYIAIGAFSGVDDSIECTNSSVLTAQVDIFASSHPNSAMVNDVTDDVRRALSGWADETAMTMHPVRIVGWDVRSDPDPTALHGYVIVEAMVEEDG